MASALAIVPRQLINVAAVRAAVVGCLDDTAPLVGNLMHKELRTARDELAAALALLDEVSRQ